MSDEELHNFFQGGTIGFEKFSEGWWYYRGQGYDDGWRDLTREELLKLYHLIGDYLMENQ